MDKRQQALLERFFKEETMWYPEHWGLNLAAGICVGIAMVLFLFPVQTYEGDYKNLLIGSYMEVLGLMCYVKKFMVVKVDGVNKRLYDIIRFLSISRFQLALFRVRRLLKWCIRLTVIALGAQITFGLVWYHSITFGNIAMPLLCNLIVPMVLVGVFGFADYLDVIFLRS